jgi:TPR repeat protein
MRVLVPLISLQLVCSSLSAGTTVIELINETEVDQQQARDAEKLKKLRESAEAGDAEAQYNLGWICHTGEHPDGRIQVTVEVGIIDYQSKVFVQDFTKALKWLRLSAKQGFAKAQNELGLMYQKGAGVETDLGKAVDWYRLAAKQGLAEAQNNLARMYFSGHGVKRDLVKSYAWARLAANGGSRMAKRGLSILEGQLTQQQLSQADKLISKGVNIPP